VNSARALASKERKAKGAAATRLRRFETLFSVLAGMLGIGAYATFRLGLYGVAAGLAVALLLALVAIARLAGRRRQYLGPKGRWRDLDLISDEDEGLPAAVQAFDRIRRPWTSGPPPGEF
jgi:hypothetical protein